MKIGPLLWLSLCLGPWTAAATACGSADDCAAQASQAMAQYQQAKRQNLDYIARAQGGVLLTPEEIKIVEANGNTMRDAKQALAEAYPYLRGSEPSAEQLISRGQALGMIDADGKATPMSRQGPDATASPPVPGSPAEPSLGGSAAGGGAKPDGTLAQTLNAAGNAALTANQPAKAVDLFSRTLEADPRDKDALLGRAVAFQTLGDRNSAKADAAKVLRLDPKNRMAAILASDGAAIPAAGRKFNMKPDFGGGGQDDAAGPRGGGKPAAAFAITPAAASARPAQSAPAATVPVPAAVQPYSGAGIADLLGGAREKLRLHDLAGASMDARQAADQEPLNAKAWAMLAEISGEAGNFEASLQDAKTALTIEPANPQALRAKAYAELKLGRYREAYSDALAAARLDPRSGLAFLYLAMAEEKLGKTAEALKHFELAVQLDTNLAPMAQDALARLRGDSAPTGINKTANRHLFRGAAIAASLILILLGMLGTTAGRQMAATARRILTAGSGEAPQPLGAAPAVGPGTVLGGSYRVMRELGRGGMGVVFEAFDDALQRRVAVKQLRRGPTTTTEELALLLAEARLVAQLRHPRLAEIYNVIDDGDIYLVFEFVDGQPLDQLLKLSGRLAPAAVDKILFDVSAALDYAHDSKIIHRDLKPSNIMVTKDGGAKILDFGIAHQSQTSVTTAARTVTASGTPAYMAPEQGLVSVSKAADMFALGAVAYEMLTGAAPFPGPDFMEQKLRKAYVPASARNPLLPKGVDELLASALDPNPTGRPESGARFLESFRRLLA